MVKTLLGQVKQYKKASLLTPLFTALEVVMEVLIPWVTSLIIDRGIEAGNIQQVYFYGGIMVIMAMASLTFGILAGKYAASASSGLACNLREGMYENIQRFSFSNIDKYSTAGLVTRLTTDVTNVQNAYQMILRMCTRAPLMLISAMVMCFFINARLSLVFVAAIVVLGLALVLIILKTTKIFDQVFKKYDALNESVQENVSAIRVVKAYVREDYENTRFSKAAANLYRLFVKAEGILAFNNPVMMFIIYGCILGISWLGAQMIVVGSLTTGELTAMFSYIMNIMMSLMMLSMIFVMVTMSLASCRRIAEVLEEQADIKDPVRPLTDVESGSIDFEQVHFAYKKGSGKETLSAINLHIRAGETIGIIGGTGSGKSSMVNLISRLYDVTDGKVLVGGRDVRDYDLEALRNQVAVVLQKNVLFSGTILDNLRWGNEQATLEECKHACKLACADTFIEQLPDKYDTVIDQGGTNVSGGQKQRICIARALLKKPKVLILDDSTSAVDTATDARIRNAFISEIPGTTKLIIAQRISSVEDADRILVMDEGRVDAFDTPDNLLKTNAIYQEIYASQVNGGGDFDEGSMEMEAVS
ncbi:ABC transporter ATP-binding protein [Eubacterium maltosivorans]|uniref:ABC transporter ATP-binding protein n=1 Tax=Eubacterium maltosivorans TaxID=2041044 RepID=A0A4P9C865_EUBML|nr:ABC transporter ATP-binding protein [Eubacterium maltosivorans]QCT70951.1 ABC transporter ATP-binding protein [Eubacterium maltosivorans]